MNTKVSVIVPVYNVEKYMKKSLNSLKNQTMKELEFICINDGSTDGSLKILKEYAKKDSRFKIYTQKNKGAGETRNLGIKYANGEYIAFLDPDDWLNADSIENLYKQAKKQKCDMLVFDYQTVDEKSGNIINNFSIKDSLKGVYNLNSDKSFSWKDIRSKIFGGLWYACWNKLYKTSFLREKNIHFAKCSMSEDNPFTFSATLNANKIGYNKKAKYNYLMRSNSAVHSITDRNFCVFQVIDSIKKVLRNCCLDKILSEEFDTYLSDTMLYHYKRVKSRDKFAKQCKRRFNPKQSDMIAKQIQDQNIVFRKLNEIVASLQQKREK